MKSINKLISACALLLAATVYSAQQMPPPMGYGYSTPEEPVGKQAGKPVKMVEQVITIYNATNIDIYGGIYLTNLSGTKILNSYSPQAFDVNNRCRKFSIKKPADKKSSEFHRIILTTNSDEADKIASGTADKSKLSSDMIKWFSGDRALHYKVTLNKKDKLKIERMKKPVCNTHFTTALPY